MHIIPYVTIKSQRRFKRAVSKLHPNGMIYGEMIVNMKKGKKGVEKVLTKAEKAGILTKLSARAGAELKRGS